jgi:hypothetical protein
VEGGEERGERFPAVGAEEEVDRVVLKSGGGGREVGVD